MSADYPTNGKEWKEYRLLVLNELKTLHCEVTETRQDIAIIRKELENVKIRVAGWSGAVAVVVTLVSRLFF